MEAHGYRNGNCARVADTLGRESVLKIVTVLEIGTILAMVTILNIISILWMVTVLRTLRS